MMNWSERVVFITGGSRGIGAGIVEHFVHLGATVLATATTPEGVVRLSERYASGGSRFSAYCLDLSCRDSIQGFLGSVKASGLVIDTLINNAGITEDRLSIQLQPDQWDRVINTNLSGTFFLTQGLLRGMIRKRFGRIVMLSSVLAFSGNPGQAAYCASKAGLEGLMKALALEVASRNITVNAIAPGYIATDMTEKLSAEQKEKAFQQIPMGVMGQVEDIVHSCVFLASAEARYITGQTLHVNGGLWIG